MGWRAKQRRPFVEQVSAKRMAFHLEVTAKELDVLRDGVELLYPDSSSGRILRDLLEERLKEMVGVSRESIQTLWSTLNSTRSRTVKRAARRLSLPWPAWLSAAEVVGLVAEVDRMQALHRELMRKMGQPGYRPWKPKGEKRHAEVELPTAI
jgi:hypothetical protein